MQWLPRSERKIYSTNVCSRVAPKKTKLRSPRVCCVEQVCRRWAKTGRSYASYNEPSSLTWIPTENSRRSSFSVGEHWIMLSVFLLALLMAGTIYMYVKRFSAELVLEFVMSILVFSNQWRNLQFILRKVRHTFPWSERNWENSFPTCIYWSNQDSNLCLLNGSQLLGCSVHWWL